MKINKFLFTVVASASLMIGFTGCNGDDEFLEEHSYKYDDSGFYNTEEEMAEAVNVCYREVQYLMQGQTHGYHSWMIEGLGLDTFSQSGQDQFSNWNLLTASSGYTRHWYNELYYLVNYANTAIDAIDEKTEVAYSTDTKKNELRAEAVFFQAWAYRTLAGMYGNVPLLKHHTTEITMGYIPTTRDTVWQYCYEQLDWARQNLPTTPRKHGCVTKAAADHLLAEVALALGKFTESEAAATRIIDGSDGDYKLMTTRFGTRASEATDRYGNSLAAPMGAYWDLFRCGSGDGTDNGPDHADNKEAIWVSQYDYGSYSQGGGGDAWWRVYCNTVESNWFCGSIQRNTTNRTVPDNLQGTGEFLHNGQKVTAVYIFGDDAACPKKGDAAESTSNPATGTTAKIDGRKLAMTMRDSLGGGYSYQTSAIVIPTRWAQYGVWEESEHDFRGSETMIQRNWYNPGGMHRYDAYKLAEERAAKYPDVDNFQIKASDTTAIFARFWKFSDDKHPDATNNKSYDVEWYMMRVAETYLLRAEARLALGNKQGAADDINVLRNRAGASTVTAADIDIDLILDERIRELLGEEQRQITLNRLSCNKNCESYVSDCYPAKKYDDIEKLGAVCNVLVERTLKYGFSYDNRTDNESVGRVWIESEKRWQPNIHGRNFQYPIPEAVISSNTGYTYPQNPGY